HLHPGDGVLTASRVNRDEVLLNLMSPTFGRTAFDQRYRCCRERAPRSASERRPVKADVMHAEDAGGQEALQNTTAGEAARFGNAPNETSTLGRRRAALRDLREGRLLRQPGGFEGFLLGAAEPPPNQPPVAVAARVPHRLVHLDAPRAIPRGDSRD